MAVRQYVGARYVPKFYEFNNGVWQSNTEYEPLTIVQYNGNSYTSKKSVPANIGNPSENDEYWAATGNYNAQVEAYRQEVAEVKTSKVTNLANRKFIFVADSYGVLGWTQGVIDKLDLDAHALNVGGAGFKGHGGGDTWETALTTYTNTLTPEEKNSITDIIILGGINDYGQGITGITNAITSFLNYTDYHYPNAKVGCGCLSWANRDNDVSLYINQVITTYQKVFSSRKNAYYIPNMYLPMHNYENMDADGIHPTTDGVNEIVNFVCNWLQSGDTDYIVQNSSTVTMISGVATGSMGIDCTMDKTGVDIHLHASEITFDSAINFNDLYRLTNIATISGGCVMGNVPQNSLGFASISLNVGAFVVDENNNTLPATAIVSIYNGYIAISGISFATYGGATANVKKIYLGAATYHAGLLLS